MTYDGSKLEDEFLYEVSELMAEAEIACLTLEREGESIEMIDLIFRISHTIKGSGYVAGFDHLSRFAHEYENMLSLIRSRVVKLTPEVIALMFDVHDVLKAWATELKNDSLYVADTAAILKRINAVCRVPGRPSPAARTETVASFGFFEDEPAARVKKPEPSPSRPMKEQKAEVAPPPAIQHADSRKPKVLIVDDEVSLTKVFASYLEDLDVDVLTAHDGKQALAIMMDQSIDLLITDFMMPQMNGLQLIEKIRSSDSTVQVIFVSAAAERRDVISILNMGAFAFLEKPFEADVLLTHARNALREKYIRDAIIRLTSLNFKAYITSSQLARAKDEKTYKTLYDSMQKILDEITLIQNSILKHERKLSPAA
ncbi:MAG TPA: response regulator [Oligoflexus sp.]|uniref:response regulator n=1 Tax=Oligoflexus sp. TaxID=1971216 RepID=UPI002D7E4D01|nr:response regulator [Oligoflexus sp.]HET9239877.1 response regulator [Oligoflexus sp.]